MFCSKCGKELPYEENFCSHCGISTIQENDSTDIKTGNSSVNIGVGNLPNSNIHIGDKIVKDDESILYDLDRTTSTKLPVKAWWGVFAGALGVIGSIASIYSVLSAGLFSGEEGNTSLLFLMPISMVLLALSVILIKTKFLWLQYFGFELDKEGFVRFIRLKGKCPLCTGSLSIRYSGPEGARSIGAICSRNPEQHRFTFDPTWLDEIGSYRDRDGHR